MVTTLYAAPSLSAIIETYYFRPRIAGVCFDLYVPGEVNDLSGSMHSVSISRISKNERTRLRRCAKYTSSAQGLSRI